jgi:hypothetical protein
LGDLDRLFTQIKREKQKLDILFANAGVARALRLDLQYRCEGRPVHSAKGATVDAGRQFHNPQRVDCRQQRPSRE